MRPRDVAALGLFVKEGWLDGRCRSAVLATARGGDPTAVLGDDGLSFGVDNEVRRAFEVTLPEPLEAEVIARLESLRPRIEAWWGEPLAPCDAIAVLRYPTGAFYLSHRDRPLRPLPLDPTDNRPAPVGWSAVVPPEAIGAPAADLDRRRVSVVVFVNAHPAFAGGHLRLFDLPGDDEALGLDVAPEAGTAIAFPSDLLHEVRPVTQGERITIVTWLLAP